MSLYYAVASTSGREGRWTILADGDVAEEVERAAVSAVVGVNGSITAANMPFSVQVAARRLQHLQVLTKPRAIALVGRGGMESYEAFTHALVSASGTAAGGASPGGSGASGGGLITPL